MDWDLYCAFYDALTPYYSEISTGAPDLSVSEAECKSFAGDKWHSANTWNTYYGMFHRAHNDQIYYNRNTNQIV